MRVFIQGREYTFIQSGKDDNLIRSCFNELAQKTFGIDFEEWYQNGYWGDDYIPYILLDEKAVVANVSVNRMHLRYNDKPKLYIQIGTVMTAAAYRNKGLSRWLMEKALADWQDNCEALYLFANKQVIGFYPRFGFEISKEYQYTKPIHHKKTNIVKLNMASENDRVLLLNQYALSNPYSALPFENNPGLLMFYCTQYLKDNIYYLPDLKVTVIAKHDGENMLCYDIYGRQTSQLDDVMSAEQRKTRK